MVHGGSREGGGMREVSLGWVHVNIGCVYPWEALFNSEEKLDPSSYHSSDCHEAPTLCPAGRRRQHREQNKSALLEPRT